MLCRLAMLELHGLGRAIVLPDELMDLVNSGMARATRQGICCSNLNSNGTGSAGQVGKSGLQKAFGANIFVCGAMS